MVESRGRLPGEGADPAEPRDASFFTRPQFFSPRRFPENADVAIRIMGTAKEASSEVPT